MQGKMRPIISAIINIVVSILFAQWWGLAGVLWGTAVARLTTNAWFDPYLVYKHGLHISPHRYMVDYIAKATVLGATGLLCVVATSAMPTGGFCLLVIKAITSFLICNIVFIFIFHRTEEFKYLFSVARHIGNFIKNK